MPDAADVMASIVREELAHLTVRPFNELTKLPPYTTKEVARDGHKLVCTTYHELISSTEHQILVQVIRRGWLGLYHRIHVDSFVVKSPAEQRELTDEKKWPYT